MCNLYKSLLTALIIAIMALAIIPMRAFAEPIEFTDIKGIKYTLTENADGETYTMTVSGSGDMEDYLFTDPLYIDYRNNITNIVIESGVEHIGQAAFMGCTALKSVTIPEGVKIIGDNAFYMCRSLTSIKFPSSLKSIGINSFCQCYALSSVEIPEGVEIIDIWAFFQCTSLTSVTLPSTVTTVGNSAFNGCTSLDNIILPNDASVGSKAIPDNATQVKYTVSGSEVTITEIILGEGKNAVTIPAKINGMDVVAVAEDYQEFVDKTKHTTHTYGADNKCTICGAAKPAETSPTVTTTESNTSTSTETTTDGTDNTGTTGSSSAWWEPAPVFTTASAVTSSVTETTVTDKEIIYGDDPYSEDVSAGAGAYEENRDIPGGLIAFAFLTVLAAAAVLIKKLIS